MIGSFFWNPSREILQLPFINLPLLWYGALFASGFALGYWIFANILKRYLMHYPEYQIADIKSLDAVSDKIENANSFFSIKSAPKKLNKDEIIERLNSSLNAPGFQSSKILTRFENRCEMDERLKPYVLSLKGKSSFIADKILLYMVIATIIGSRLGHFLFYEDPSDYLNNLSQIFHLRDGGHASHGAAIGILIATVFFCRNIKKYLPQLSWLKTLDLICIPAALGGAFIRIGNFFNQEVLGKESNLPWSVIFGNPADLSAPVPRHPVQLYEAIFYLTTFLILFLLSRKDKILLSRGKLIGIFLILVFSFRFFIEYFKEDQSFFSLVNGLNMGQLLSIPLVLLGFVFIFLKKKSYNLSATQS